MADDKQDTEAAKAYEAAAGQMAPKAKSEPVKKAPAEKAPAAKKAAPKKTPAAKKAPAPKPAAKKPVAKPAPKKAPVKAAAKTAAKPAPKATEAAKAPEPVAKLEEVAPKVELEASTAPAAVTETPVPAEPAKPEPVVEAPKATAKPAAKPAPAKKETKPKAKAPAKAPAKVAAKAPAPAKTAKSAPAKTIEMTQEFVKMTDTEMMTKSFQDAMAEMTSKSQEAYTKSTEMLKEASEFAKGNLEAMVEAGKIFASGIQEMGKAAVADSKAEFESMTAEVKEMAGVKSPTDFFQMQSALVRKNFDKAVAMSSKNTEAMLKLANDAAQPLSTRMSLAMDKIKAA